MDCTLLSLLQFGNLVVTGIDEVIIHAFFLPRIVGRCWLGRILKKRLLLGLLTLIFVSFVIAVFLLADTIVNYAELIIYGQFVDLRSD